MKPTPYAPFGLRRPLLVVILPLLALAFQPATVCATTYYFSRAGNNNSNGTSPSTAKRDLSELVRLNLIVPGNAILFRRGDTWSAASNTITIQNQLGTPNNEIYIGSYYDPSEPSTANPIISTLHQEINTATSFWTRVGSTNTWRKPVSYSDAWRVYVNGASKAKILTTNPEDVNQSHEWYIQPNGTGGGTLYVNTSPTGNAPQNVELQRVGSSPALKMTNCNYVTVQNLEFRGGSQWNVIEINAPGVMLTIDKCVVKRGRRNGILVTHLGSVTGHYINGIEITNCTVDRTWTKEEDNVFIDGGDGIVLKHAVENGTIFNNEVLNWPHTGIEVAAYRSGFHGVHNIVVEWNRVTAGESGYMHPFSVYGHEGAATDIIVKRNFFYDYTSTSHAMGNSNKYFSNIFARARRTTLTVRHPVTNELHSKQPYGIDMATWQVAGAAKAVPTDPNVWIVAHDNVVANNTFYDIDEFPIYLYEDPAGPTIDNNAFYNNLLVNYGDSSTPVPVGLDIRSTVEGKIYARNNNFWDSGVSQPDAVSVARYKNGTYTAAALSWVTALPGETPVQNKYCSGNLQRNPLLQNPTPGNNFALGSNANSSLKTGGMVPNATQRPPAEEWVDYFDKPWRLGNNTPDNPGPSIGAIQAAP